jgi:aspartate kinase
LDCLKAAGEDLSARFVAAVFAAQGLPAIYIDPREVGLLLTNEFGNAQLLPESYENLRKAFAHITEIAIFPGFFGYTKDGDVATFPRGGSDITGAILAAALNADVYENFTDVDSVYPVDPRLVPHARHGIAEMTYREMRELSYAGFGVFHDEAVLPAIHAEIPINIRNTNRPKEPGTMVVSRRPVHHGQILGIASDTGFCTVYVSKFLMNREIGFGRRLLQIFEEEGISFEHTPSGIDNMSVVLREANFKEPVRDRVLARIRTELSVDEVTFEPGQALVMVVGEGMRYTVGLAARITTALASAGVNIEMINQGSSEISVMFGVRATERQNAVRALYEEFFLHPGPDGGKSAPAEGGSQ